MPEIISSQVKCEKSLDTKNPTYCRQAYFSPEMKASIVSVCCSRLIFPNKKDLPHMVHVLIKHGTTRELICQSEAGPGNTFYRKTNS